ncbi:hypothetical protein OG422_31430 (plasmid) [Streptomyces sp. NBC_01525]|uniref:hypothetical protein n=1 Tax=Streptomyces sp. NBC_01525 TaxID=2903893 RepID=UPI002F914C31
MGTHYYISADQQRGARWSFTAEDLAATATRIWPDTTVDTYDGDTTELQIHLDDETLTFIWDDEYKVLRFPDHQDLEVPARVVHRLLRELAPDVPAVWWSEADATLEPVDLSPDPEPFAQSFGG